MLETLHSLGFSALEVSWDTAKISKPVAEVDMQMFGDPRMQVNISTLEQRQALIDRVVPVFNNNLWLSTPPS